MNAIFAAAVEVDEICRRNSFKYCFIGGLAVQRWGQPRMTADVDLTVVTGFGGEEPFVDALLGSLQPRISDARGFALMHRTLLVRASNGVHADISLGAMPFEERAAERATPYELGDGQRVLTCSAEDLIVHKAFAARDKDWLDIDGIVVRQRGRLQLNQIWEELEPLLELKDDRVTASRLRALFEAA